MADKQSNQENCGGSQRNALDGDFAQQVSHHDNGEDKEQDNDNG